MKEKKNILVFTDWYLPAYKAGGPVKSVAALAFYLKEDFNFYIITGNKDVFAKEPLKNIESNQWQVLPNGEKVYYFSDDFFSWKNLSALLKTICLDAVYLNSFFSTRFTVYPLLFKKAGFLKAPILLAPRGMLSSGALQLKSRKKNIFIRAAKLLSLYKNVVWHATSVQEETDIKNIFGNTNIFQISNLGLPPLKNRTDYSKENNTVKICCLARISKVKNILFALEVLQQVNSGIVIFDIYGPAEEADYYNTCQEFAQKLPAYVNVFFKGDLQGNEVEETLKNYHLFFLPTLNENFGHAIVESMLNGCIPLISNTTPWRNLQAQNIGWDIALNEKEKFVVAVNEMIEMKKDVFEERSKTVQQYARLNCLDENNRVSYKKLFTTLTQ